MTDEEIIARGVRTMDFDCWWRWTEWRLYYRRIDRLRLVAIGPYCAQWWVRD